MCGRQRHSIIPLSGGMSPPTFLQKCTVDMKLILNFNGAHVQRRSYFLLHWSAAECISVYRKKKTTQFIQYTLDIIPLFEIFTRLPIPRFHIYSNTIFVVFFAKMHRFCRWILRLSSIAQSPAWVHDGWESRTPSIQFALGYGFLLLGICFDGDRMKT